MSDYHTMHAQNAGAVTQCPGLTQTGQMALYPRLFCLRMRKESESDDVPRNFGIIIPCVYIYLFTYYTLLPSPALAR